MSSFFDDGYQVVRFLDQEQVEGLRSSMEKVFQSFTGCNLPLEECCVNLFKCDWEGYVACASACQNLLQIQRIFTSVKMEGILNSLGLVSPNLNTRPLIQFSSEKLAYEKRYWKVPAHQDWPSNQGSLNGVTCWVPLQDTDKALGALEVMPGSHWRGSLDHEYNSIPVLSHCSGDFHTVEMKAGDALFFNTFLIHRSGENVTNSIRFSVATRFNDLDEETYLMRKYPVPPPAGGRKKANTDFPSVDQLKKALQCGEN